MRVDPDVHRAMRGRRPLERLLASAMAMEGSQTEADVVRLLVDEAHSLLQAQRVLVAMHAHGAALTVASARLPPGESATELLERISPWLEESRRTRVVSLRHGP